MVFTHVIKIFLDTFVLLIAEQATSQTRESCCPKWLLLLFSILLYSKSFSTLRNLSTTLGETLFLVLRNALEHALRIGSRILKLVFFLVLFVLFASLVLLHLLSALENLSAGMTLVKHLAHGTLVCTDHGLFLRFKDVLRDWWQFCNSSLGIVNVIFSGQMKFVIDY